MKDGKYELADVKITKLSRVVKNHQSPLLSVAIDWWHDG